ncbi:MAG: hypothetical protein HYS25_13835 [Ignavibacteriales bacterium]|nr:hypothetical protein [Ignavibacteriales bacterium]
MALKYEHYYNNTWNDISDYVTDCGDIPFLARNRDMTPQIGEVKLSIAVTIRIFYNNQSFSFDYEDKFRIFNDSQIIFAGYTTKTQFDWGENTFNVTVTHRFAELDNKYVDYDTLHNVIYQNTMTGYEYRRASYYPMPIVYYNYLLRMMFSLINITLDASGVDEIVILSGTIPELTPAYNYNIKMKEIFVGEDQLFCLNQNIAAYYGVIDNTTDYDYAKDKLTCWKLIQFVCGSLGYRIDVTGIDSAKLTRVINKTNYSVVDDKQYDYSEEKILAEKKLDAIGISIAHASLQKDYLAPSPVDNSPYSLNYGKGSGIEWINHLNFFVTLEVVPFDVSKVLFISNVWSQGSKTRVATETPHGLSGNPTVIIYGVQGYNYVDNDQGKLDWTVDVIVSANEFDIGANQPWPQIYKGGGWVWKSSAIEWVEINNSAIVSLLPTAISTNATLLKTVEWTTLNGDLRFDHTFNIPNLIKNQVDTLVRNYVSEEIKTDGQFDAEVDVLENNIGGTWGESKINQEHFV